ncbi:hypothetical protein ATCVMN08101_205L [Acanthocystis turfacea Chlorella virus MN0810.1]|nr:hypothetical protein ATCVMN08101_205L [Acanthocystis turfacea Chlorella virus MN0810.1]
MAPQAKEHDIEMGNTAVGNNIVAASEHPPVQAKPPTETLSETPAKEKSLEKKPCNGKSCKERDDDHNYNSLKWRFFVQVGMTATVSSFCITMMAVNGKEGIYLPVLTGILGYWLPSPDFRVKRVSMN